MTTHRKRFASTDELSKRLEESAAIVASYEQEQPMTQQTIGNTVYTVGQELKNYTEAGPLLDYMYKNYPDFVFYRAIGWINPVSLQFMGPSFPMLITALPNPDPVAEDWREVEHPDKRAGGYPEAMQEVCKADEVGLKGLEDYDIPDRHIVKGRSFHQNDFEAIVRCFLLGGRVFVKGGV